MDKRLVNTLLRVVHSPDSQFQASQALTRFCLQHNLGLRRGSNVLLTPQDKREIAQILQAQLGIEVTTTTADSWHGLNRAESLTLARDEKLAGGIVDKGRVLVKAMPGKPVQVGGGTWTLPRRADLGFDVEAVVSHPCGHDSLLLIENKQTFHDLWDVALAFPVINPLVIFRGEATGGARADASHALISQLPLPVAAFVDLDPAGMIIAAALPRLDWLVAPDPEQLTQLLEQHGLPGRYSDQLATAGKRLQEIETHPIVGASWQAIRAAGKGLPQEFFHAHVA